MTEFDVVEHVLHEADRLLKNWKRTSNVESNKCKNIHGSTQNEIIPSSKSNVCQTSAHTRKKGQIAGH